MHNNGQFQVCYLVYYKQFLLSYWTNFLINAFILFGFKYIGTYCEGIERDIFSLVLRTCFCTIHRYLFII